MNDEKLQERYNEIRKSYVANLVDKFAQIETIENEISKNNWNDKILMELYEILHNIAGASGMFGYEELSKTARELEIYLGSNNYSVVEKDLKRVFQLLDNVKQAFKNIYSDS